MRGHLRVNFLSRIPTKGIQGMTLTVPLIFFFFKLGRIFKGIITFVEKCVKSVTFPLFLFSVELK